MRSRLESTVRGDGYTRQFPEERPEFGNPLIYRGVQERFTLPDLLSGQTLWPSAGYYFEVPGVTGLQEGPSRGALTDRAVKKLPTLRGRTVVNLFYEDSTRTRVSFEAAAKRLEVMPTAALCLACQRTAETR